MPLTPVFEIGLLNAWIFMLSFLFILLPFLVLRIISKDEAKRSPFSTNIPYSKVERRINILATIIFFLLVIYSVFLPLQLRTIWFYLGLAICSLALIMSIVIVVNWVTTPFDKPITKGIYRYSRHPMYLTQTFIFVGAGIASASWIFLLFSIVLTILSFILIIPEEQVCLENYGKAYREYMNRTPRWLGIPKPG